MCYKGRDYTIGIVKGSRMGRPDHADKVSLWCVALLAVIDQHWISLFFNKQLLSVFNVTLRQRVSK